MSNARDKAIHADAKMDAVEHVLHVLRNVGIAFIALVVTASLVFSAIGWHNSEQAVHQLSAQTKQNHLTGEANASILAKISKAQANHSATINEIVGLQADLDHKFSLFVHAACPSPAASHACKVLLNRSP